MLSIEEIIEIADTQVFEHQGQHLNDLQRVILEGTLNGKSHQDIAQEQNLTEEYIKDSANKLWHYLTQSIGEKLNKFNIRTNLGRYTFSSTNILTINSGNVFQKSMGDGFSSTNILTINSGRVFQESLPSKKTNQIEDKKDNVIPRQDLTEAPEIEDFYGREEELSLLQTKILEQKCSLIVLLGIRGIGKTALALELMNKIKENFDWLIYKSLYSQPTLTELITEIIGFNDDITENNSTYELSDLKKALAQERYLIILDDINCVFKNQQLSGQ